MATKVTIELDVRPGVDIDALIEALCKALPSESEIGSSGARRIFIKSDQITSLEALAACLHGKEYCREAMSEAYEAGWRCAAHWAKREDLFADVDSPAYIMERDEYLDAALPPFKVPPTDPEAP